MPTQNTFSKRNRSGRNSFPDNIIATHTTFDRKKSNLITLDFPQSNAHLIKVQPRPPEYVAGGANIYIKPNPPARKCKRPVENMLSVRPVRLHDRRRSSSQPCPTEAGNWAGCYENKTNSHLTAQFKDTSWSPSPSLAKTECREKRNGEALAKADSNRLTANIIREEMHAHRKSKDKSVTFAEPIKKQWTPPFSFDQLVTAYYVSGKGKKQELKSAPGVESKTSTLNKDKPGTDAKAAKEGERIEEGEANKYLKGREKRAGSKDDKNDGNRPQDKNDTFFVKKEDDGNDSKDLKEEIEDGDDNDTDDEDEEEEDEEEEDEEEEDEDEEQDEEDEDNESDDADKEDEDEKERVKENKTGEERKPEEQDKLSFMRKFSQLNKEMYSFDFPVPPPFPKPRRVFHKQGRESYLTKVVSKLGSRTTDSIKSFLKRQKLKQEEEREKTKWATAKFTMSGSAYSKSRSNTQTYNATNILENDKSDSCLSLTRKTISRISEDRHESKWLSKYQVNGKGFSPLFFLGHSDFDGYTGGIAEESPASRSCPHIVNLREEQHTSPENNYTSKPDILETNSNNENQVLLPLADKTDGGSESNLLFDSSACSQLKNQNNSQVEGSSRPNNVKSERSETNTSQTSDLKHPRNINPDSPQSAYDDANLKSSDLQRSSSKCSEMAIANGKQNDASPRSPQISKTSLPQADSEVQELSSKLTQISNPASLENRSANNDANVADAEESDTVLPATNLSAEQYSHFNNFKIFINKLRFPKSDHENVPLMDNSEGTSVDALLYNETMTEAFQSQLKPTKIANVKYNKITSRRTENKEVSSVLYNVGNTIDLNPQHKKLKPQSPYKSHRSDHIKTSNTAALTTQRRPNAPKTPKPTIAPVQKPKFASISAPQSPMLKHISLPAQPFLDPVSGKALAHISKRSSSTKPSLTASPANSSNVVNKYKPLKSRQLKTDNFAMATNSTSLAQPSPKIKTKVQTKQTTKTTVEPTTSSNKRSESFEYASPRKINFIQRNKTFVSTSGNEVQGKSKKNAQDTKVAVPLKSRLSPLRRYNSMPASPVSKSPRSPGNAVQPKPKSKLVVKKLGPAKGQIQIQQLKGTGRESPQKHFKTGLKSKSPKTLDAWQKSTVKYDYPVDEASEEVSHYEEPPSETARLQKKAYAIYKQIGKLPKLRGKDIAMVKYEESHVTPADSGSATPTKAEGDHRKNSVAKNAVSLFEYDSSGHRTSKVMIPSHDKRKKKKQPSKKASSQGNQRSGRKQSEARVEVKGKIRGQSKMGLNESLHLFNKAMTKYSSDSKRNRKRRKSSAGKKTAPIPVSLKSLEVRLTDHQVSRPRSGRKSRTTGSKGIRKGLKVTDVLGSWDNAQRKAKQLIDESKRLDDQLVDVQMSVSKIERMGNINTVSECTFSEELPKTEEILRSSELTGKVKQKDLEDFSNNLLGRDTQKESRNREHTNNEIDSTRPHILPKSASADELTPLSRSTVKLLKAEIADKRRSNGRDKAGRSGIGKCCKPKQIQEQSDDTLLGDQGVTSSKRSKRRPRRRKRYRVGYRNPENGDKPLVSQASKAKSLRESYSAMIRHRNFGLRFFRKSVNTSKNNRSANKSVSEGLCAWAGENGESVNTRYLRSHLRNGSVTYDVTAWEQSKFVSKPYSKEEQEGGLAGTLAAGKKESRFYSQTVDKTTNEGGIRRDSPRPPLRKDQRNQSSNSKRITLRGEKSQPSYAIFEKPSAGCVNNPPSCRKMSDKNKKKCMTRKHNMRGTPDDMSKTKSVSRTKKRSEASKHLAFLSPRRKPRRRRKHRKRKSSYCSSLSSTRVLSPPPTLKISPDAFGPRYPNPPCGENGLRSKGPMTQASSSQSSHSLDQNGGHIRKGGTHCPKTNKVSNQNRSKKNQRSSRRPEKSTTRYHNAPKNPNKTSLPPSTSNKAMSCFQNNDILSKQNGSLHNANFGYHHEQKNPPLKQYSIKQGKRYEESHNTGFVPPPTRPNTPRAHTIQVDHVSSAHHNHHHHHHHHLLPPDHRRDSMDAKPYSVAFQDARSQNFHHDPRTDVNWSNLPNHISYTTYYY